MSKHQRDTHAVDGGAFLIGWWAKDGAWHTCLPHIPTEEDRKAYWASYPPGDDGPFYRWDGAGYDTAELAIEAARTRLAQ